MIILHSDLPINPFEGPHHFRQEELVLGLGVNHLRPYRLLPWIRYLQLVSPALQTENPFHMPLFHVLPSLGMVTRARTVHRI